VQGPGNLPKALDRPAQRLLGITALRRCDDPLEILDQSRISRFQPPATSPCMPHPTIRCRADRDLIQSTANGAAAIPVIRDTAAIPPQPAANASLVAKTRRCRSSGYGPSISKGVVSPLLRSRIYIQ